MAVNTIFWAFSIGFRMPAGGLPMGRCESGENWAFLELGLGTPHRQSDDSPSLEEWGGEGFSSSGENVLVLRPGGVG